MPSQEDIVEYVAIVNMTSEARNNWCQTQAVYQNLPLFYRVTNTTYNPTGGRRGATHDYFTSLYRLTYADYCEGNLNCYSGESTPEDMKLQSQQLAREARERFPSPLPPPRP